VRRRERFDSMAGHRANPGVCKKILDLMTLDDADDVHVQVHVHVKLPNVHVSRGFIAVVVVVY
jgi:hypothetical protein